MSQSQLDEAIQRFRDSVTKHLPQSKFGEGKGPILSSAKRKLGLPDELCQLYQVADPVSVTIPTVDGQLVLYPVKNLVNKQRGFRTHAKTGRKIPEWNASWVVIGDEDGDPYLIDARLKRPPHPILRDYLGTEHWSPARIADSFPQFLDLLRAWVDIIVGEYGMKITDKEDRLLATVESKLGQRVEEVTDDPDLIDYWTYPVGG